MAIRRVKDAKDIKTKEKIYFKGHAKATYMSNGVSVEDTINDIKENVGNVDLSGVLSKSEASSTYLKKNDASSTYLKKTDASNTYLGKTEKAASAVKADSATKATQDGNGNTITATYATKSDLSSKYSKPSSGIPKSDLNSSVQSSLSKADSALQSIPSVHNVTAIDVNASIDDLQTEYATKGYVDNAISNLGGSGGGGSNSGSSSNVDLTNYATKTYVNDIVEGAIDDLNISSYATKTYVTNTVEDAIDDLNISNYATKTYVSSTYATKSEISSNYATKSYVNSAINDAVSSGGGSVDLSEYATKAELNDKLDRSDASLTYAAKSDLNNKQDILVSGVNIKTINGKSIVGSGNITIEGGGSGSTGTTGEDFVVRMYSSLEGDDTINNVEAKVIYGSTTVNVSNGEVIKIPADVEVTVEFPPVNGYNTPEKIHHTVTSGTNEVEVVYYTSLITINVSTEDGVNTDGLSVVVEKMIVSEDIPDFTVLDENGVAIMDIAGKFYKNAEDWIEAGRPTPNGIAVSDGTHRLCIALENYNKPIWLTENTFATSSYPYQQIHDIAVYSTNPYSFSEDSIIENEIDARSYFDGASTFITSEEDLNMLIGLEGFVTKAEVSAMKLFIYIFAFISQNDESTAAFQQFHTFPNGFFGILGSAGEWVMVSKVAEAVDTLMQAVGGTPLSNSSFGIYWTSTPASVTELWAAGIGIFNLINTFIESEDEEVPVISGRIAPLDASTLLPTTRLFAPAVGFPKIVTTTETLRVVDGKVTFKAPVGSLIVANTDDLYGYNLPETIQAFSDGSNQELDFQYTIPKSIVYAVTADGELIDYHNADSSCIGLAIVTDETTFMISDVDIPYVNHSWLEWGPKSNLSIEDYSTSDEARNDFNGRINTEILCREEHMTDSDGNVIDVYTAHHITKFNEGDSEYNGDRNKGFSDWYIPSAGQMYLIYKYKDQIEDAMNYYSGFDNNYYNYYWTSSECDNDDAWWMNFSDGYLYAYSKSEESGYIRPIRDL